MSDLNNEVRESGVQEQVHVAEVVNEEKNPVLEGVKAKLEPIVENVREKIDPVVEDVKAKAEELKEKAAPVIEKVKATAEDAVDAVKDGADKISDFFSADVPGLNVKNELFDELGEQVAAKKDAAKAKAEEMQALLEKMMGKK